MKRLITFYTLILITLISAQDPLPQLSYSLKATAQRDFNDTVSLVLSIGIPKEHHLYGNPLGPGVGKPTKFIPGETVGFTWIDAHVQEMEMFTPPGFEDQWVWSWHDKVDFVFKLHITDALTWGSIELDGLICKDACIPVYQTIEIDLTNMDTISHPEVAALNAETPFPIEGIFTPKINLSEKDPSKTSPAKPAQDMSLWWAVLLAFVAGIILNFMPCVLPVLGIKILAFSQGRSQNKRETIIHSLVFGAGMLLVFLALAGVAIAITQTGKSWAWGQQFQSSLFTIIVISLIYVFSLGMFDLFIILVPTQFGEMDQKQDSGTLWGNFLKGVFATIMATPCSGPLLGGVLAWALNGQSPVVILVVFTALGLGMASPYILLASFDRLARLIPKPGAWMEDFKHALGFVMLGFTIWLIKALPHHDIIPTLSLLLSLTAALMLYSRIAPFGSSLKKKSVAALLGLLLVVITILTLFRVEESSWEPFTEQALIEAQEAGQDIIIDFTADWCLNCQSNKTFVYNTKEMTSLIAQKNIKALRADLTRDNPIATAYRDRYGSKSVPFLAILPEGDQNQLVQLRDIVTKKQVFEVLEKLSDN